MFTIIFIVVTVGFVAVVFSMAPRDHSGTAYGERSGRRVQARAAPFSSKRSCRARAQSHPPSTARFSR